MKKKIQKKKNILIFDLGGGTLDVTCLKYFNDKDGPEFRVKGHSGHTLLGGEDFDNKLINHYIQKFEKENSTKINKDSDKGKFALKRLKNACEEAKKILSTKEKHVINIESLYGEDDLIMEIDRTEFEFLCKEYFDKLKEPIEAVLNIPDLQKMI